MKRGSAVNRILDRYVGIPVLFTTSVFNRRRTRPTHLRTIGIASNPTLGDTLINSAAVVDIRENFPESRILFFASQTNAAAVNLLPGIDEVVTISMTAPWRTLRTIRRCNLDILIDFTSWQRITAFYTAFSGAKYRVGFRTPGQHRHWHYDLTADHSRDIHELENFRNVLRSFGLRPLAPPQLNLPQIAAPKFESFRRHIIFHPWATGDNAFLREWPNSNWRELARQLATSDTLFLVTGSPAQRPRSEGLCQEIREVGAHAQPYVGDSGLTQLCVLLRNVDLVVSVNTGIMHLSAILGAPTVAINGPTAPHRWGPVGPRAVSVAPHGGGGGFLHLGFEFQGNPVDTMGRTRVSDVVAAAQQFLPVKAFAAAT